MAVGIYQVTSCKQDSLPEVHISHHHPGSRSCVHAIILHTQALRVWTLILADVGYIHLNTNKKHTCTIWTYNNKPTSQNSEHSTGAQDTEYPPISTIYTRMTIHGAKLHTAAVHKHMLQTYLPKMCFGFDTICLFFQTKHSYLYIILHASIYTHFWNLYLKSHISK